MSPWRLAGLSAALLAHHRLRTALSVLGVGLGVAAVIVTAAIGRGAEAEMVARVRAMGTDLIAVNAGQTRVIAGRARQMSTVTTLSAADAEAIAELPSVAEAAAALNRKTTLHWGGTTATTTVVGAGASIAVVRDLRLAAGRFHNQADARLRARVAVLGPTVVANLFGGADPFGRSVRIGRVPFTVIGVTAPKGVDAGGVDQDDQVYIPLSTAMRRVANVDHVDAIYAQIRGEERMAEAETAIAALLRERHRLRGRPDDFTVQNQASLLAHQRETAAATTLLTAGVAAIALMVGGVGILAVMLLAVRERTHEIGLRRALGASRAAVRWQFLLEATGLSLTGGVTGLALGIAGILAARALTTWRPPLPWDYAVAGVLITLALGVLAGAWPATRAARLDPVVALQG
ncbi:MAG: ABC transporter permease [Planctomycetota bacterium]